MMLSVILLSMSMMLFSTCDQGSDLWQQLDLASEFESDIRDTLDWFHLTSPVTLVLLK